MCNMCDSASFGCPHPSNPSGSHCHYERHQQQSRGLLNRTSSTSTVNCHQHTTGTCQIPGGNYGCSTHSRSQSLRQECSQLQPSSHQTARFLNDLKYLLGQRCRDSELSNMIDDICRSRRNSRQDHNSDDNVLKQLLDTLLEGLSTNSDQRNGAGRKSFASNSSDREVPVDLLMRVTSSTNRRSHSTGYPRRRLIEELYANPDFDNHQQAWMARNVVPIVDGVYSWPMRGSNGFPSGMGIPSVMIRPGMLYGDGGGRAPRWPGDFM